VIAGLPPASWVLILASVGLGLALELAFYRSIRRRSAATRPGESSLPRDGGPPVSPRSD
jgi:hypothetical protein